ncbi:hypothetical protein FA13DRAFT_242627 [Coprinellus micaceus]|uniref:Uncharacterized protein n=1 Tax=Coprinellus micaceus TaxID=71717 RepID=A0A4Y7SET8_COPMI|nr:hypothetical protein FA13DRAFT_242627 [Coprinellus micaceus]
MPATEPDLAPRMPLLCLGYPTRSPSLLGRLDVRRPTLTYRYSLCFEPRRGEGVTSERGAYLSRPCYPSPSSTSESPDSAAPRPPLLRIPNPLHSRDFGLPSIYLRRSSRYIQDRRGRLYRRELAVSTVPPRCRWLCGPCSIACCRRLMTPVPRSESRDAIC